MITGAFRARTLSALQGRRRHPGEEILTRPRTNFYRRRPGSLIFSTTSPVFLSPFPSVAMSA